MMNFKNLPENWKAVRLGRVADIHQGKTPRRSDYLDFGRFKILKVRDITENRTIDWGIEEKGFISEGLANSYKHYTVKENDILFTASAHSPEHIGKKLVIVEKIPNQFDDVFHVAELIRIRAFSKQLNSHFLYYLLSSEEGYKMIQDQVQGVHVYPKDLANLFIPLAPLPEQKRIVEILSLAEDLIKKQKEAIALIDKILMAKFLEMFGDPATNPKGWEVRRLSEMAIRQKGAIKMGPFGSQIKKSEFVPTGIKVYGQENVIKNDFSIGNRFITLQKFKKLKSCEIHPGDILLTMMGTIGHIAIFPENAQKGIMDSHLIRIKLNKELVNPVYLRLLFKTSYLRHQLETFGHGVVMKGLNATLVKNLKIPLPPIELQKQFAQIVEEFEKKRKEMQNTLEILESLFKVLQKKAFTGELTAEWREKQKIDWELPKITERQAILLALLYYSHVVLKKPAMLTFAMKETFLLQREAGLNLGYMFIPYKYGPFSKEVYKDLEELEKNLLVEKVKPNKDIEKTEVTISEDFKDWVEKLIDNLPESHKTLIQSYVQKYGTLSYNELIDYVYSHYPEFSTKSKRKKK